MWFTTRGREMALDNVALNGVLILLQSPLRDRLRIIRRDARRSVIKEKIGDGERDEAMDFYMPFWSDAKEAVFRDADLSDLVAHRILKSKGRRVLYNQLRRGFEAGWAAIRAELLDGSDIEQIYGVAGAWKEEELDSAVRIGNFLGIKEKSGKILLVYPYFCKDQALGPRASRLAVAAITRGLHPFAAHTIVILDVLRGTIFTSSDLAMSGYEEGEFSEAYGNYLREWRAQKRLVFKT